MTWFFAGAAVVIVVLAVLGSRRRSGTRAAQLSGTDQTLLRHPESAGALLANRAGSSQSDGGMGIGS